MHLEAMFTEPYRHSSLALVTHRLTDAPDTTDTQFFPALFSCSHSISKLGRYLWGSIGLPATVSIYNRVMPKIPFCFGQIWHHSILYRHSGVHGSFGLPSYLRYFANYDLNILFGLERFLWIDSIAALFPPSTNL